MKQANYLTGRAADKVHAGGGSFGGAGSENQGGRAEPGRGPGSGLGCLQRPFLVKCGARRAVEAVGSRSLTWHPGRRRSLLGLAVCFDTIRSCGVGGHPGP